MCSLCRLPVAKNHNFVQMLNFWGGSCTGPFLPMRVKYGALEQTERLHLRAKFNLNVFIVSPSGGQKPQFFLQILNFWRLLYRLLFTDKGQIWCHEADRTSTLTCQISSECSLCRLPVDKNHNFGQILTFGGLLYRPPITDEGQTWCATADRTSTLTCQISSKCVHCVAFRRPKTTILGKF